MRKVALCGLMLFVSMFLVAPAAQASDQSIRDVVSTHAQRQAKEDARFIKAARKLSTKAKKKLLDALDLYTTGLRRFQQGLNMALRNGGNSGITKAKRAIKNMNLASK